MRTSSRGDTGSLPAVPRSVRALVLNDRRHPLAVTWRDRIAMVNESYLRLFGFADASEIVGRCIYDRLTPRSLADAHNAVRLRMEGRPLKDPQTFECIRADGETFWLEAITLAVSSDPSMAITMLREVTPSEDSITGLREMQSYYRTLTEALPLGVIIEDHRGRNIYVNRRASELTLYSREELLAGGICLTHPDDVGSEGAPVGDLEAREQELQTRFVRKDGSVFWACVSVGNITGLDGRLLGRYSIFRDISMQKAAEHEARTLNEELESRVRMRTAMLAATNIELQRENAERKEAQRALAKAEEQYRLLAENASDIIWQMNLDGIFTYVSAAVRQYGYEPEEWIGHDLLVFLPPEEHELYLRRRSADRNEPSPRRYEVQMLRKDGSGVWMEVLVDLIFEDGVPFRLQGVARDITQRRIAQNALRESEQLYRSIVENTRDLIMLTHADGQTYYLSPAVRDLLGYEPSELIGSSWRVIHPDDLDFVRRINARALAGEPGSDAEYRVVRKDGQVRWVSHSWSPILSDGALQTVVSIVRDVTERRVAEQTLREAHSNLEKAYELQRQFLNNVSHEVRTPLTAVKGYAEMLLEGTAGPVSAEQAGMLRKVAHSTDSLLDIVGAVLEIARVRSGTVSVQPRVCQPCDAVRRAIAAILPQAEQKGLRVRAELPSTPRHGMYDEGKLTVIVANLLSNAVKFTPAGGIDVLVTYTDDLASSGCPHSGCGVEIIIADTGIGIRRQDFAAVFDEFRQMDYPGKHKPAGFGIGLAIVAAMVEAIGGTFTLSSKKGVGTAFTLQAPALNGD